MTVMDWLLDSDPAIRWQVLRDLVHAPADVVAAERARVATEGWGARLLALQGEDGQWAGGACFPAPSLMSAEAHGQPWISTLPTLQLLCDFGVDPSDDRVRRAMALVKDRCRWEHAGQPFFSGEVEPCINGRTVTLGTYSAKRESLLAMADELFGMVRAGKIHADIRQTLPLAEAGAAHRALESRKTTGATILVP